MKTNPVSSSLHTRSVLARRSARFALRASLVGVAAALLFVGCETTQTTSGQRYLEHYPTNANTGALGAGNTEATAPNANGATAPFATTPPYANDIDRRVAEVAALEPTLRFPARIGLARIERGRLVNVPAGEAEAWTKVAEKLGPSFGKFLPINLIATEMVAPGSAYPAHGPGAIRVTIDRIRLGAARQHVDVVLIYEVALDAEVNSTPWSLVDLTIVGGVIGTRKAHAEVHATALLIDVRNGYTYGQEHATALDEKLVGSIGRSEAVRDQREKVTGEAVGKLIPKVETMMVRLAEKLPAMTSPTTAAAAGSVAP